MRSIAGARDVLKAATMDPASDLARGGGCCPLAACSRDLHHIGWRRRRAAVDGSIRGSANPAPVPGSRVSDGSCRARPCPTSAHGGGRVRALPRVSPGPRERVALSTRPCVSHTLGVRCRMERHSFTAPRIEADLVTVAEPPTRVRIAPDEDDPTSAHLEASPPDVRPGESRGSRQDRDLSCLTT